MGIVLTVAMSSCSKGSSDSKGTPGAYSESYNVLLITIDTLRADHLGSYGYHRDTSPAIDALASRSVLFERAISTSATTLPSHLSILTGLYPHQHGLVANRGGMKHPFYPMDGRRSVAELLEREGYSTAAFVSGKTLKGETGIRAGFQTYIHPSGPTRLGLDTNQLAFEWLNQHADKSSDQPFFAWVHYWDPHEPNEPPAPYDTMFATDERLKQIVKERNIDPARLQNAFDPGEIARIFHPHIFWSLRAGKNLAVPEVQEADVWRLLNQYDGDIRYTDDCVQALLGKLEELGLAERTIIIVVSDHGQALGRHDWLDHGRIHDENIHVPLIIHFPDDLVQQPQRIQGVVSTVDIMPTVMARLPLKATLEFEDQAEGKDLLASEFNRPYAFSHRSERPRPWEPGRKFALTYDDWKLHRLEEGSDQLYNLKSDPGELVDIAHTRPEALKRLEKLVRRILDSRPAGLGPASTLTDAEKAAYKSDLRALGYFGDEED